MLWALLENPYYHLRILPLYEIKRAMRLDVIAALVAVNRNIQPNEAGRQSCRYPGRTAAKHGVS